MASVIGLPAGLPFGLASTKTFAIFASSNTNEIVQLGDESSTACLLASPKCHDRAATEDHLRRDAGSPSKRRRFSFDLSASLSLPSFSWLSPSWALSLGISWLTSWLSYRPCSSARPSWRPSLRPAGLSSSQAPALPLVLPTGCPSQASALPLVLPAECRSHRSLVG